MHIGSGLALRRDPAQSDVATTRASGLTWLRASVQVAATRARLRKILPGAILLAVLAVLGAMFPIVF
jgi:hypothetical protein